MIICLSTYWKINAIVASLHLTKNTGYTQEDYKKTFNSQNFKIPLTYYKKDNFKHFRR